MKKTLTAIFILISLASLGQKDSLIITKDPKTGKLDSLYNPFNNTEILSTDDLNAFLKALDKLPHEDFLKLTPKQTIQYLYQYGVNAWDQKRKKKKTN